MGDIQLSHTHSKLSADKSNNFNGSALLMNVGYHPIIVIRFIELFVNELPRVAHYKMLTRFKSQQ